MQPENIKRGCRNYHQVAGTVTEHVLHFVALQRLLQIVWGNVAEVVADDVVATAHGEKIAAELDTPLVEGGQIGLAGFAQALALLYDVVEVVCGKLQGGHCNHFPAFVMHGSAHKGSLLPIAGGVSCKVLQRELPCIDHLAPQLCQAGILEFAC